MAAKRKFKPSGNTSRPGAKQVNQNPPQLGRHHANPKPPDGYVFVAKGDVYITRKCTTLTQAGGQEVHIVYDHKATRIGLHVPKHVWRKVLAEAAQTTEKREETVRRKDDRDMAKAEAVLRKRYPNMPPSDLEKVLHHAFMKGSRRVGRTSGQSAERRASLAVGAYVRHTYTAYDDMLNHKEVSREQARDLVWKRVREVKLGWTGKGSNVSPKEGSAV